MKEESIVDLFTKRKVAQEELRKVGQPPKAWVEKTHSEIKFSNPGYSDEQIRETINNLWCNELTDFKREEVNIRYGELRESQIISEPLTPSRGFWTIEEYASCIGLNKKRLREEKPNLSEEELEEQARKFCRKEAAKRQSIRLG